MQQLILLPHLRILSHHLMCLSLLLLTILLHHTYLTCQSFVLFRKPRYLHHLLLNDLFTFFEQLSAVGLVVEDWHVVACRIIIGFLWRGVVVVVCVVISLGVLKLLTWERKLVHWQHLLFISPYVLHKLFNSIFSINLNLNLYWSN